MTAFRDELDRVTSALANSLECANAASAEAREASARATAVAEELCIAKVCFMPKYEAGGGAMRDHRS